MKQKAGSVRLRKKQKQKTTKQRNRSMKSRDQRLNYSTYDKNKISNHCENDTRWKNHKILIMS